MNIVLLCGEEFGYDDELCEDVGVFCVDVVDEYV